MVLLRAFEYFASQETRHVSAVKFWTQLAESDRGLPRKIIDFNLYPLRAAHVSHVSGLWPEFQPLLPGLTSHKVTCRQLFERLPPKTGYGDTCWDFSEPRLRLALLESSHLQRILTYAGAALLREEIAREIARPRLAGLIQRHGPDLYQFALKKAHVLLGSPKVFPAFPISGSLADSVEQAGKRIFEHCFQGQCESFLHRLELRFPADWTWDWSGQESQEVTAHAWKWLHRIATREIAPETSACFE